MTFFWDDNIRFKVNIGSAIAQALNLLERGVAAHEQLKEEVRMYRESRNPNTTGTKDILFQQLGIMADSLRGIEADLAPRLHSSLVETLVEKHEASEALNRKLEADNADLRGRIERLENPRLVPGEPSRA